jgi:hypothetical protein
VDKQGIFLQISKSQSTSALIFVDWKGQVTPVGPQDAFISGGRKEHLTLIVEANETSWARKVTVINKIINLRLKMNKTSLNLILESNFLKLEKIKSQHQ